MSLPDIGFSKWIRWTSRTNLDGIDAPGVYMLARFTTPPVGNANPQARQIIYVGETCNKTLKKRWRDFHRAAFQDKDTHSGGKTYWEIFGDNGDNLFVAAFPVNELSEKLRPLFIRYVERKIILEYALKWGAAPKCNKK